MLPIRECALNGLAINVPSTCYQRAIHMLRICRGLHRHMLSIQIDTLNVVSYVCYRFALAAAGAMLSIIVFIIAYYFLMRLHLPDLTV